MILKNCAPPVPPNLPPLSNMPTHAEKKILPYTRQQLFELVGDIENYPEFLPWCLDCRITERENDDVIFADLVIGYKFFREKFTSRVHLYTPETIRVEYQQGPLKYLSNEWNFFDNGDGTTTIDFYVDFEFKNALFQKIMGVFFNEIVRRMVGAFETRARELYGDQAAKSSKSSRTRPS
jgi:coenzyme Q-binding protein COQ10